MSKNKLIEIEKKLFAAMGFSPADSIKNQLKADLYVLIVKTVRDRKLTQHEIFKVWDVPQSRVSDVMRGKLDKITVDALLEYTKKLVPSITIEVLV